MTWLNSTLQIFNFFNSTLSTASDWKTGFLSYYFLFSSLPFMVMIFSGKRLVDGINDQKTVFQILCDFAPTRRQVISEAMSCYLDIVRGFWFMFYMTLLAPLYPFYYVVTVIVCYIYKKCLDLYYLVYPKRPVFQLDGPDSVIIDDETGLASSYNSRDEFPIGYSGPRVGTLKY